MNNQILITTTNAIENAEIERYLEIVNVNVVIGTNVFSDFGASITDFFGGQSETYQNKLHGIYKIAIEELKNKAKRIGANAIVGLKIDFDEISGKGKSMFMISALGTAVIIKQNASGNEMYHKTSTSDNEISHVDLNIEMKKQQIIQRVNSENLPTQDVWNYLMSYPIIEITEVLLDNYIALNPTYIESSTELKKLLFENLPTYFLNMDREFTINLLYNKIEKQPNHIFNILKICKLYNSEKIKELLEKGFISSTIECLKIDKETYLQNDIAEMKSIIKYLDDLPDLGSIETSKGLMSKSTEVYICPYGHKNSISHTFCQQYIDTYNRCKLNIKGLTEEQTNTIEEFKLRVKTLESLLLK